MAAQSVCRLIGANLKKSANAGFQRSVESRAWSGGGGRADTNSGVFQLIVCTEDLFAVGGRNYHQSPQRKAAPVARSLAGKPHLEISTPPNNSIKMIILIILCSNWKQLYQVLQTLTPDQSQLLLNQSCGACYVVMGKLFFTPDGLSDLGLGRKISWRQSWWGFSSGKICSTCHTGFIMSWACWV